MALLAICVLLTCAGAMNSMKAEGSGPGVTALIQMSNFLRVSCAASSGKEKITYITLNISKNVSSNDQVAIVDNHNPRPVQEGLKDVAVRGYINNSGDPPSAYLEISYQELPHANKTFVCDCQSIHPEKADKCELNERWEDAVVYVCGTEAAPDDITNIVVVKKNGERESFVGPNSTSASDVAKGMQYWGDGGQGRASTWVVFKRSSRMLHLITSRDSSSDSHFCRISTRTGGTRNFPMNLGDYPVSEKVTGDAEAEKGYSWLGYPFLVLVLVAVIVVLILRERYWRSITLQTRHNQLDLGTRSTLISEPSTEPEINEV